MGPYVSSNSSMRVVAGVREVGSGVYEEEGSVGKQIWLLLTVFLCERDTMLEAELMASGISCHETFLAGRVTTDGSEGNGAVMVAVDKRTCCTALLQFELRLITRM